MSRTIARYAITFGLSGCYMPDSHSGPIECATRRELADAIRSEIEFYEFPKGKFADARIRNLWTFIKSRGSSVAHFSIEHKGYQIGFHGLTEDEAEGMRDEF